MFMVTVHVLGLMHECDVYSYWCGFDPKKSYSSRLRLIGDQTTHLIYDPRHVAERLIYDPLLYIYENKLSRSLASNSLIATTSNNHNHTYQHAQNHFYHIECEA